MPYSTSLAVARVKQVMDCITNNTVAPLVENALAIDQVLRWLDDEDSRLAYQQELSYMVLRHLVPWETARRLCGNTQKEEWEQRIEEAKKTFSIEQLLPFSLEGQLGENERVGFLAESLMGGYIYKDIHIQPGDVVIDAGAYIGDTLAHALLQGAAEVHCFEPSSAIFSVLCKNADHLKSKGSIYCVNKGISNTENTAGLWFNSGASRIVEGGEEQIACTTVDAYCAQTGIVPTFLKMDIEGAEPYGIQGAAATIANHAPKLAICLYHTLSDMWTVPTLIKSLRPDYRLYVRSNNWCGDFVLYGAVAVE